MADDWHPIRWIMACIRVDRRPLNFRAGVRTRSTAGADDLVTGPASLVQWLLGCPRLIHHYGIEQT